MTYSNIFLLFLNLMSFKDMEDIIFPLKYVVSSSLRYYTRSSKDTDTNKLSMRRMCVHLLPAYCVHVTEF